MCDSAGCKLQCQAPALLLLYATDKVPDLLKAAVPAFFRWLDSRLSGVRVLNVECHAESDEYTGRWVWPHGAGLAPRHAQDGAELLRAIRLVVLPTPCPAFHGIAVQHWLRSIAPYQRLTALCLKGFTVPELPVMPQFQVLMYGDAAAMLSQDLLESVARQPRLVSLQLSGQLTERLSLACLKRLRDMTRLRVARLDLPPLKDVSFAEHIALPERCSVALMMRDPSGKRFSEWSLRVFTSLRNLCVEWIGREGYRPKAPLSHLLAALPDTIESLDITYPRRFRIKNNCLTLSRTVKALRLRADGPADGGAIAETAAPQRACRHAAPHAAAVGRSRGPCRPPLWLPVTDEHACGGSLHQPGEAPGRDCAGKGPALDAGA